MVLSKNNIFKNILTLTVFILSVWILPYYYDGDQFSYRRLYSALYNVNFLEIFKLSKGMIDSIEPIYLILAWISSNLGLDKDIFISISNATLVYLIVTLLQQLKFKVSLFFILFLIMTNYYLIVLYFSAERLKFGLIFVLLSMIYINTRKSFLFSFIAMLTHLQTAIIYGAILAKDFTIGIVFKIFKNGRFTRKVFFLGFLFLLPLFFLQEQLLHKLSSYQTTLDFSQYIKTLVFFIVSLHYAKVKEKREVIIIFMFLLLIINFVGDTRVNIFSYFIFLYYTLQRNKGYNLAILITSLYYGYKSIDFIFNIINYGNGFYK